MVFVKNRPFSHMFFFLSKKKEKETFFHILDKKECFLDKKEQFQKTLKNRHFAKGLVQGFDQKIDLFLITFFFWAKKQERNILFIFWIEKKVFWTSKVKFSQSRKKSTFFKGVSLWFLSKNRPFFLYVFFEQKKP